MSITTGNATIPEEIKKLAFDLWLETGTTNRAALRMGEMGLANSNRKPYSQNQVSLMALDYLLESYATLEEQINDNLVRQNRKPYSHEEYMEFVVNRAIYHWGARTPTMTRKFYRWIDANHLEDYEYLWKNTVPSRESVARVKRRRDSRYLPIQMRRMPQTDQDNP